MDNTITINGIEYVKKQKNKSVLSLQFAWEYRLKLKANGDKLKANGDKLWAEGSKIRDDGDKLRAEGSKLCAEGDKRRAEGDKLRAEGSKLWAEAIISTHGNIKMEWKNYNSEKDDYECHLENGEVYKP